MSKIATISALEILELTRQPNGSGAAFAGQRGHGFRFRAVRRFHG